MNSKAVYENKKTIYLPTLYVDEDGVVYTNKEIKKLYWRKTNVEKTKIMRTVKTIVFVKIFQEKQLSFF